MPVPPEIRTNRRAPRLFAALSCILGLGFCVWGAHEMKQLAVKKEISPIPAPRTPSESIPGLLVRAAIAELKGPPTADLQ